MDEHEINKISENVLFDIFMDNVPAKEKLWQIFTEKVNGRRSMVKAKLLAKHMTFLEHGRPTKSQSHKKSKSRKHRSKKKDAVHALQQTGYDAQQPTYPQRGRGRGYRGRGRGRGRRHTTKWRQNRFSKPRGPHNPGQNCHLYGHTADTCWTLHPELRPKSGTKRAEIFAIQRRIVKAQDDLERAVERWEESTESEEPATEYDQDKLRKENDEYSTSSEEDTNGDTESSSPNYKYRPRQ